MNTMKKSINLAGLLILTSLFITVSDCNAQSLKMTAKDLTKESTAVLYGKCSKIKSQWNENKSIIYTYITIIPEEYIKGNLGPEAVIAVPGGRVDDIVYEVSEMPVFTEGEEIVAFIWTNPAGKNLVTGGSQGKMKIDKDPKTGERMVHGFVPEVKVDAEKKGAEHSGKTENVLLEDFVSELKGYLKN